MQQLVMSMLFMLVRSGRIRPIALGQIMDEVLGMHREAAWVAVSETYCLDQVHRCCSIAISTEIVEMRSAASAAGCGSVRQRAAAGARHLATLVMMG